MMLIDKIIWGFLAFFFLTGWMRGFLRSLLGPVAFVFCFISAVIFYDINRNILMASVILFAGSIALGLTLSVLLSVVIATINKEYRGKVFLLSRILGAAINVAWQGNILFIIIILFSIMPTKRAIVDDLRKQIPQSTMVSYYKAKVVSKDSRYQALIASLESIGKPSQVEKITQMPEFKAFQTDAKVQAFIHDPNVMIAVEEQDSIKLLKTDSLRELVTNDSSMYLFTNLAEKVYLEKLEMYDGTAATTTATPKP